MARLKWVLGLLALTVISSVGCTSLDSAGSGEGKGKQEKDAGASSSPAPVPPPLPSKIGFPSLLWDGKHPDAQAWTKHLMKEIESSKLPDLVPSHMDEFSPTYPSLSRSKRTVFWAHLISAMAKHESGFKPQTKYVEQSIYDAKGENVVSRGLLQISVESGRSYGCVIPKAEDLHDPTLNLSCAVRIMARNVERHGRFAGQGSDGKWKGASAYWSVMRSVKSGKPRASYLEIRKHMAAQTL